MFEERNGDQTITWAYSQICAGARPWTALGNFMNAWYGYAEARRPDLIKEAFTGAKKTKALLASIARCKTYTFIS